MFVPAPPAQAAPALAPVSVIGASQVGLAPPLHTRVRVRRADLNVLAEHSASVTGALLEGHHGALPGLSVTLQARLGRGWRTIAEARTRAGGRFRLSFTPHRVGSEAIRVRFAGDSAALPARHPLGRLNVYRLAEASWYGGGGSMACGGWLSSSTLGVANKTLPCGTLVTLRYGGRTVRVPVVDRGPYVAGREFDLTEATKQALGFGGVGQVWSTS
jgi:rare lipoprotein A